MLHRDQKTSNLTKGVGTWLWNMSSFTDKRFDVQNSSESMQF